MQTSILEKNHTTQKFPAFSLERLLKTVFDPQKGEKVCVLIDLQNPNDVINFAFLKKEKCDVQKKAYEIFYKGIKDDITKKFDLGACDFFAYQTTGGSNLELPSYVVSPDGQKHDLDSDIYRNYDIILYITDYSATAPATASAKKHGFRGATMHGVNDVILSSGLAIDYNEVSKSTEKLRQGMTNAESVDVEFKVQNKTYHLNIDLGNQNAQKSHGLCRESPDIANLPAGEVYFIPMNASGEFPLKFEEDNKTIGLMHVENGRVTKASLISGNQKLIDEMQLKLESDPATGVLGELGFGTQVYPYAGKDIQDEKIFGTFHIATGRNDHLNGNVTKDKFKLLKNASHDDILFSSTKTPEIEVKKVTLNKNGKAISIIENYEPSKFLLDLLK
jgi:hypothetical protein